MILFIQHIDIEGPETLGDYFDQQGYSSKVVRLNAGDALPAALDDIDAVISLGGPMNVYEEDKYPFLKGENTFIEKVIHEQVPFLGICLGSQLLAKACKSQVILSPKKEVGFSNIQLTEEGMNDQLFKGIDKDLNVYQWHEDMSQLPDDAKLLASSDSCPHQAFKVGSCAYGLQFHIEITDKSIMQWSKSYIKDEAECSAKQKQMLDDYERGKDQFVRSADIMYCNFLNIIKSKKTV